MNVPWFDIVLGNGERVRCSADENAELYRAVPGCYGTSGIITRAAVHLIEAKRYVHLHYRHFARVSDYVAAFGDALDQHQYVEGFIMGLCSSAKSPVISTCECAAAAKISCPRTNMCFVTCGACSGSRASRISCICR